MVNTSTSILIFILVFPITSVVSHADVFQDYTTVFQVENDWGGLGPLCSFDYLGFGYTDGIGCYRPFWGDVSTSFYLFANNGSGVFTEIDYLSFSSTPTSVTGDYNGDGFADLFEREYQTTDVVTFFRDSVGLGEGISYSPEYAGYCFDSGDFNNDSRDDICGISEGRVFIWYSTGSGAYTAEFVSDSLGLPYFSECACEDLDDDNDLDIFVVLKDSVFILENDGSGLFNPAYSFAHPLFTYYTSVSFADLDNNLFQDIIIASQNEADETALFFYMNMGNMNFTQTTAIIDEEYPFLLFCEDIDLDYIPDLAINMEYHMCIFKGYGDGSFESNPSLFESSNFGDVLFGDYDLDGDLDMAAVYHADWHSYLRIYWNSTNTAGIQELPATEHMRRLTADQNPFSSSVELNVSNTSYPVTIQVFDLSGRAITSLTTDNQGSVVWNGQDAGNQQVCCGTYLLRVNNISCNHIRILKI